MVHLHILCFMRSLVHGNYISGGQDMLRIMESGGDHTIYNLRSYSGIVADFIEEKQCVKSRIFDQDSISSQQVLTLACICNGVSTAPEKRLAIDATYRLLLIRCLIESEDQ